MGQGSPPPFDLGSPKSIGYTLLPVTIFVVIYSSLPHLVSELSYENQNMGKAPAPPPHVFDLHAPKSIGLILMVMSLNLVNLNDLAQAILALKRESQN